MRREAALFLALALASNAVVAASPARAQGFGERSVPVTLPSAVPRIDTLFLDLKRAASPAAAERIASGIRREWSRSGSASIDLLMERADVAMRARNHAAALDLLDQVVLLAPDYAEGWNRRARLHLAMNDHAKSMADMQRVLLLEPRHFGALAGMAAMFRNSGRRELAMRAYERLLDVYPMMRSAQTQLGELADELTGQGI